jgi:hypothetical protein
MIIAWPGYHDGDLAAIEDVIDIVRWLELVYIRPSTAIQVLEVPDESPMKPHAPSTSFKPT